MNAQQILKEIKKQKQKIDMWREAYFQVFSLQQKIGSGYGVFMVHAPSHRKNKQLKDKFPDIKHHWGKYYELPNTEDNVKAVRELGCKVSMDDKPFVKIMSCDYSYKGEWDEIMKTVSQHNIPYVFTQNNIANFLSEIAEFNDSDIVQVKHLQQIIIVDNIHFHFSERECVKVININDSSFSESLETFNAVRRSIDILVKRF